MVVDDDPVIRALLHEFCEEEDFEVQTAPDGPAALAIFTKERFDVIFVDFQMPGMTGLEMATAVRKTNSSIPIALISGTVGALVPEAVAQAGIDRIFAKPFKLAELADWLQSLPL